MPKHVFFWRKMPTIGFFESPMIIALDRAIPYWEDAFSDLGEIWPLWESDMKPENVRDADALIVRSITPINSSLLDASSVRFVASASAGTDHVDQDYLKKHGIHFSYAAGCNAEAVSEYIIIALLVIAIRRGWELKSKSLAVIGVGHVGSRVVTKARALGMEVLLCDPPLRDLTGDSKYQSLDNVLGADILSFHVPLVCGEPYPTWHMLDSNTLDRLSPSQFVVNSARGPIVDNLELKLALRERRIAGAILDVWEGEPRIDYSLLDLVDIGTPHIAGSGLDGKIRATEMAHDELCGFLGIRCSMNTETFYPKPRLILPERRPTEQEAILSVLLQAFDITKDDAKLRALKFIPAEPAAEGFARLRSHYSLRPEFRHFIVDLTERYGNLAKTFAALGFELRT
jgi:erythronate-4-phosphate dehydrogenase